MSFNWTDFLGVARELAHHDDEAAQRSAISRAYYAAYGVARAKVGEPDQLNGGGQHQATWNMFHDKTERARRIRQNGNRLRLDRNEADYSPQLLEVEQRAEKAIKLAEKLVEDLTLA